MPLMQPGDRRFRAGKPPLAVNQGVVPGQRGVAKGVVMVHEFAPTDMLDNLADGAFTTRGHPTPIVALDRSDVTQQRVPICPLEGTIKQIQVMWNDDRFHGTYYTTGRLRKEPRSNRSQ